MSRPTSQVRKSTWTAELSPYRPAPRHGVVARRYPRPRAADAASEAASYEGGRILATRCSSGLVTWPSALGTRSRGGDRPPATRRILRPHLHRARHRRPSMVLHEASRRAQIELSGTARALPPDRRRAVLAFEPS